MSIALADNPNHIRQLCARLAIGRPELSLSAVKGGFHHRVWQLRTETGVYAVKQLSTVTDLGNQQLIAHFNFTEAVAEGFRAYGIHSISALPWQGEYLQLIGDAAYLVYPWSKARGLAVNEISEQHALQVAGILATMHRADIAMPGLERQDETVLLEPQIIAAVARAGSIHVRYAAELEQALPVLLEIAQRYRAAVPVLGRQQVISHGDLDQKNVLWDEAGQPLLIDWESARPLNPTHELLQSALEWSGISHQFNPELFRHFLFAYERAGGVIASEFVGPALHVVIGDWLIWLLYVVDRSAMAADPLKRKRGANQFDLVFQTLLRLQNQLTELLSMPVLQQYVATT